MYFVVYTYRNSLGFPFIESTTTNLHPFKFIKQLNDTKAEYLCSLMHFKKLNEEDIENLEIDYE